MSDVVCSTIDAQRFGAVVTRRLGLRIDEGQVEPLAELLHERMAARGHARAEEYLSFLEGSAGGEEWRQLAAKVSVGETYFYRCRDHFRAFAEVVLPDLARSRRGSRRLRILSVGCASGEEPYTLAMVLGDRPEFADWEVSIHGLDMSHAALSKAKTGVYTAWSMREASVEEQTRWFERSGNEFRISRRLISMVRFEERNVAEPDPGFWHAGAYDVIFCRNLLIYLTPEAMGSLVERFARVLAPDGYLFLGHAETLRGVSHDFALRNTHECFYYQRRDRSDAAPDPIPPAVAASASRPPADGATWCEAITRSNERIAELSGADDSQRGAATASGFAARMAALAAARESFSEDRFDEAMERLDGVGEEPGSTDVDALILRAAVLVFKGAIGEAEAMCHRIHALDDLDAGAHFLEALCAQRRGDTASSVRHARAAAYLDPGFAMPRLHLGVLARRGGDRELAGRELREALALLPREDSGRILLFGGGFNRETLTEMCRNELAALGAHT